MIYLKIHETPNGDMIAMCDEELLGKVFKAGDVELDLEKYSSFYKGDLVSEEEAESSISNNLYSANIVGEKSVGVIIKKGLATESDVKSVKNVKYVQVYRML